MNTDIEVRSAAMVPLRPGGGVLVPQYVRDNYLPPSARELIVKGVPPHTLKTYTEAWQRFRTWCEEVKRTPAPVSQNTMVTYLDTWRALPVHVKCRGGVQSNGEPCSGHRPSPTTVRIWYSAVKFYHGVGEPPLDWSIGKRLMLAIKGYNNEMVEELGWSPDKAPRAYDDDVRRMVDSLDLSKPKHLRDRAIILVGHSTAARASDLATYRLHDIERFPLGIQLVLRTSKANKDTGKKVEYRMVFENDINPQYCGVKALDAWVHYLASAHKVTTGAIFRPFDKHDNLLRGRQDTMAYKMDGTSITDAVKDAAIRAGLPNAADYTQHSLRRGRASQLRELGYDNLAIGRALGWSPGGSLNDYLEEVDRQSPKAPVAGGLL